MFGPSALFEDRCRLRREPSHPVQQLRLSPPLCENHSILADTPQTVQFCARARRTKEKMSLARSPTLTQQGPGEAGAGPIVSTISAHTSLSVRRRRRAARVSLPFRTSCRVQTVCPAKPRISGTALGRTAKQLCSRNPRPRWSPVQPKPLVWRWAVKSKSLVSCTNRTVSAWLAC